MRKKILKTGCVLLALLLCIGTLSACDFNLSSLLNQDTGPEPVEVSLKTDLHDAMFTFTYGELKTILTADALATLFEEYPNKTDDITIDINYNDLRLRYSGDEALFQQIMGLLSDDELASLQANRAEVFAYYTRIANAIKQQAPATVYSENFWVENDSITFTEQNGTVHKDDSVISKAARLFKDVVLKGVEEVLPRDVTVEKGSDLTDLLYLKGTNMISALTPDDLEAVYASLTTETEINSESETVTTGLTRTVEIHIKPEDASVLRAVNTRDAADILAKINRLENGFTVASYDLSFNSCTITATFNAVTDELLSLSYDKNMHITATVTGSGSLESLGTQTLDFDCGSNTYYQFGWESEAT